MKEEKFQSSSPSSIWEDTLISGKATLNPLVRITIVLTVRANDQGLFKFYEGFSWNGRLGANLLLLLFFHPKTIDLAHTAVPLPQHFFADLVKKKRKGGGCGFGVKNPFWEKDAERHLIKYSHFKLCPRNCPGKNSEFPLREGGI